MYLTLERMSEIVTACDGLIKSPNITEYGKNEAVKCREKMVRKIMIERSLFGKE